MQKRSSGYATVRNWVPPDIFAPYIRAYKNTILEQAYRIRYSGEEGTKPRSAYGNIQVWTFKFDDWTKFTQTLLSTKYSNETMKK